MQICKTQKGNVMEAIRDFVWGHKFEYPGIIRGIGKFCRRMVRPISRMEGRFSKKGMSPGKRGRYVMLDGTW